MTTHTDHTLASGPQSLSGVFDQTTSVLHAIAQSIQRWHAMRMRASADRDTLANMSDRELLDIGLDRARANVIANAVGMREYGC